MQIKQSNIRVWHRCFARLACRDYKALRPVDKPGLWIAGALKRTHTGPVAHGLRRVRGLRDAYTYARLAERRLQLSHPPGVATKWVVYKDVA